jgi:uncharacterized protein YyaL (SSP411 family)
MPVRALRELLLVALALAGACGGDTSSARHGAAGSPSSAERFLGEPLPGAPSLDSRQVARLASAWRTRPPDYEPRTRHRSPDGSPKYTNRLFLESSPYLRQHAHNPVNWYPWGEEAFTTARTLGRPVLLSIGYSTCHWCHVMEEESFEDEEIARYLNEHYVAVKVDREERPDLDDIYMNAVQTLTGSGGWPMTVWLTPDRRPFYGGTYFPARDGDRGSRTGFLTLLRKLGAVYHEQPDRVFEAAASLARTVQENLAPGAGGDALPDAQVLHAAAAFHHARFDSDHGGTRGSPKFPSNLPVRLLLRHHRRTGSDSSLTMATRTLEKMAAGGIHDQVGGGFHRYATDARWLVPHFEKMLYDNALLVPAYLEGHQATGREDFADVARRILRYVERDMTAPGGAFYSATDADSVAPSGHREEGWYFTWTPPELEAALGAERARIAGAYLGVTEAGNFEGRSILHTPRPLEAVAAELGLAPERVRAVVEEAREALYAARAKRPAPLRDEKILAAWNGLMISAHAQASLALGEPAYAVRGERAADFILTHMRKGGRLLRSYKDGDARHNAYLDDYAFLIAGLLDLYEATGALRWLREAIALDRILAARYEDEEAGGFYLTSDDHEELLVRQKPHRDGAEPSGNSVQTLNLLRLHELTTDDRYRQRAVRALQALAALVRRAPAAFSELLLAVDYHLDTPKEIVIVTPRARDESGPFLERLRGVFLPNRIVAVVAEADVPRHAALVPLLEGKVARAGETTAYVCEQRVCELPTSDPAVFARQIASVRPLGGQDQSGRAPQP